MKVIIAGTRTIDSYRSVVYAIDRSGWRFQITEVVCGMAPGVDLLGKKWAEDHRIPVKEFPPDWNTYGKSAGPIRNEQMAKYADALILVWDGHSKGSANMLAHAKAHRLDIFAVNWRKEADEWNKLRQELT